MKVLILDCNKKDLSSENKIVLEKFTEGVQQAGGEVKVLNIENLDIKPCYSCTTQSSFQYNEKCRCDDDMNRLYPEFRAADTWVFSVHVNSNGSTKYLQNLLDRMEPLFQPIYFLDSAEVTMPNDSKMSGKMLLLSSFDNESFEQARSISNYIDSIALLFSKQTGDNILFEKTSIDQNTLEQFFNAGLNLVQDAGN